jgi:golgin subfamily A protein 1
MKKTLQRELRLPAQSVDGTGTTESDYLIPAAVLTPSSSRHMQQKQHQQTVTNHRMTTDDDDVNFKYLKHVLIKFLTSREYEVRYDTCIVAINIPNRQLPVKIETSISQSNSDHSTCLLSDQL